MLYRLAEKIVPAVTWSCPTTQPSIYLSFDDGPHPLFSKQIINVLGYYNISATFFVVGKNVLENPHIINALLEAGHTIGLHGMSHRRMIFQSEASLQQELQDCKALVESITNSTVSLFRPPYGQFGPKLLRICARLQLQPVMWTNMPFDFQSGLSDDRVIKWAIQKSSNGTIIVLHDGHPFSHRTVRILPDIIERLKDQGYGFGSIP